MPCRDSGPPSGYDEEDRHTQALLCGIFTVLTRDGMLERVLSSVNWSQAGMTRKQAERWWTKHQAKDRARMERERLAQEQLRLKREAYDKLTPEQRSALGLRTRP